MTNWLLELNEHTREKVFAEMRSLRQKSDSYLTSANQLQPKYGEIAAGGVHIDAFARGEALAVFLRCLSTGDTPQVALEKANTEAELIFDNWNKSRKDYQVHRNLKSLSSFLQTISITFAQLRRTHEG